MKEVAKELKSIISSVEPQLRQLNPDEMAIKQTSDEWSKKEILGHLIDSATNSHQRIVRELYNVADQFPPYDQTKWVQVQRYNDIPWPELINFWKIYNDHLSRLIENIPQKAHTGLCNIGQEEPVSLKFVVTDYIRHLQHHLNDLV